MVGILLRGYVVFYEVCVLAGKVSVDLFDRKYFLIMGLVHIFLENDRLLKHNSAFMNILPIQPLMVADSFLI